MINQRPSSSSSQYGFENSGVKRVKAGVKVEPMTNVVSMSINLVKETQEKLMETQEKRIDEKD